MTIKTLVLGVRINWWKSLLFPLIAFWTWGISFTYINLYYENNINTYLIDLSEGLLLLLLLSHFSRVQLCATPWTAAYQAPPSMGFSRQEYWSGVPLPSPVRRTKWPKDMKCISTCITIHKNRYCVNIISYTSLAFNFSRNYYHN